MKLKQDTTFPKDESQNFPSDGICHRYRTGAIIGRIYSPDGIILTSVSLKLILEEKRLCCIHVASMTQNFGSRGSLIPILIVYNVVQRSDVKEGLPFFIVEAEK